MSTKVCYTRNGILHVESIQDDPTGPLLTILPAAVKHFRDTGDAEAAAEMVFQAYLREEAFEGIMAIALIQGYCELVARVGVWANVIRIPSILPGDVRIDPKLPFSDSNSRPMELAEYQQKLLWCLRNEADHYYYEEAPPNYSTGRYIILEGDPAAGWIEQGDWIPLAAK